MTHEDVVHESDASGVPERQGWRVVPQEDGTTVLLLLYPEYTDSNGSLIAPHGGVYDTPNLANLAIDNGTAWRHADAFVMRQQGRDAGLFESEGTPGA